MRVRVVAGVRWPVRNRKAKMPNRTVNAKRVSLRLASYMLKTVIGPWKDSEIQLFSTQFENQSKNSAKNSDGGHVAVTAAMSYM